MNATTEALVKKTVDALAAELGDNLYSCCLYGSAVRGNAIEGVSDLNLLLVLNESNCVAQQAVTRALQGLPKVDPFVLGKRGFDRSVRAFSAKFASIRRNYRVLHGADPLQDIKIDPALERFLCEQALRNLRLRLAYSFITRERHKRYVKFVTGNVTGLFVHLSEVLRLNGTTIPTDFEARIPVLEQAYHLDGQVLRDLLALKRASGRLSDAETIQLHERLFSTLDLVIHWIEEHWAP